MRENSGALFSRWHHMSIMASQITGNKTVASTACLVKQQRKHQGIALLALCEGKPPTSDWWIPLTEGSNVEIVSMSWGLDVVGSKSDVGSALVITTACEISCYTGLCYNTCHIFIRKLAWLSIPYVKQCEQKYIFYLSLFVISLHKYICYIYMFE